MATLATAVALSLAACGGGGHGATTTTRPGPVGPTTTSTAAGPSGGAVPGGFEPQSFTAISDSAYWVLGTATCSSGRCPALLRTTSGGSSFVSIPAPALAASAAQQATLRFADASDGFAYLTNGPSSAFFTTHDGGATWHAQSLGDVLAFATAAGQALAVTAQCGATGCSGFSLERSAVGRDAWTPGPLPFTPDGSNVDLEAHGSEVWLMGTPTTANGPHSGDLARSTDGGRTFTVGSSPCSPGLGGELAPTSATNLWAVCPTGTEAGAWRSVDGGVTFSALHTAILNNSARLGAASADVAVLAPNDSTSTLLHTTDGGATWAQASIPSGASFWPWIGFTDAQVGAALVQLSQGSGNGPGPLVLWRTTDGGAHWSTVAFS